MQAISLTVNAPLTACLLNSGTHSLRTGAAGSIISMKRRLSNNSSNTQQHVALETGVAQICTLTRAQISKAAC